MSARIRAVFPLSCDPTNRTMGASSGCSSCSSFLELRPQADADEPDPETEPDEVPGTEVASAAIEEQTANLTVKHSGEASATGATFP